MPEYIERESLVEDIKQYSHGRINGDAIEKMGLQFVNEMSSIQRIVEKQPAVDVVEVVRCKNCKHFKPQNQSAHWSSTKRYCMRSAAVKTDENDYCSYGVRKEGAENVT